MILLISFSITNSRLSTQNLPLLPPSFFCYSHFLPFFLFPSVLLIKVSVLLSSSNPYPVLTPISSTVSFSRQHVINFCFFSHSFPSVFNHATVLPILKKSSLDALLSSNYHQISRPPFSNLLEHAAYSCCLTFFSSTSFLELLPSGFHSMHFTKMPSPTSLRLPHCQI